MANAGFIIVKGADGSGHRASYRDFYGPLDKGSAKPSFCYPKRKEALEEEVQSMKKSIESGYVSTEKLMEYKSKMRTKTERLDKINEQESAARKLFEENKDNWLKRRGALAEEITAATPSRADVSKRRVNPFTTLKKEKSGLEEKKREFVVLSRLAGEESNISFLQKD
jgi:hypothetical protein